MAEIGEREYGRDLRERAARTVREEREAASEKGRIVEKKLVRRQK